MFETSLNPPEFAHLVGRTFLQQYDIPLPVDIEMFLDEAHITRGMVTGFMQCMKLYNTLVHFVDVYDNESFAFIEDEITDEYGKTFVSVVRAVLSIVEEQSLEATYNG